MKDYNNKVEELKDEWNDITRKGFKPQMLIKAKELKAEIEKNGCDKKVIIPLKNGYFVRCGNNPQNENWNLCPDCLNNIKELNKLIRELEI